VSDTTTQPMPEEARLPELARSLRALGCANGPGAESAHAAVFGPLLDARARAAAGGLGEALASFRGQGLAARIMSRAADAARAGVQDAAHGRARAARAREALEPLREALHTLDALAPALPGDSLAPASPAAAAWTAQLARVFRTADDACLALGRALAEQDELPARRGWLGRFGR
jgi:hypothetical protein